MNNEDENRETLEIRKENFVKPNSESLPDFPAVLLPGGEARLGISVPIAGKAAGENLANSGTLVAAQTQASAGLAGLQVVKHPPNAVDFATFHDLQRR